MGAVRDAAENALAGLCVRSDTAAPEAVLNELKNAKQPAERNTWMRVLGRVGYPGALPLIEAAPNDPDATVADPALEQLGHWPNPAPVETLLKVMNSSATPTQRTRGLRSLLDLATTAVDEGEKSFCVPFAERRNLKK